MNLYQKREEETKDPLKTYREKNFSDHLFSSTPFFSILSKWSQPLALLCMLEMDRKYTETTMKEDFKLRSRKELNSFFFVLNRVSPKARDTAMSPQILPLLIYIWTLQKKIVYDQSSVSKTNLFEALEFLIKF